MDTNRFGRSATPVHPAEGRGQMSLRRFVTGTVAVAMGCFVWSRTGGDYVITTLVVGLTAAVIDIRVSRS